MADKLALDEASRGDMSSGLGSACALFYVYSFSPSRGIPRSGTTMFRRSLASHCDLSACFVGMGHEAVKIALSSQNLAAMVSLSLSLLFLGTKNGLGYGD